MRFGIDASPLTASRAGIGNYLAYFLEELLELRPEWQFYLYAPVLRGDLTRFSCWPNVVIRINPCLSMSLSIWGQTTLSLMAYRDHLDLFWAVAQSYPLLKRNTTKVFFTLHDFVYLLYPETVSTLKCWTQKLLTRKMLEGADYIFPNSYGTAQRLKKYYGIEYHAVIEPPIRPGLCPIEESVLKEWLEEKRLAYKDYLLFVGTLEPRKNLEQVLSLYAKVLDAQDQNLIYPLVLMGGVGWKDIRLRKVIDDLSSRYPQKIRLTGYVSDEEQHRYLAGARALLLASKYEGYGLPVAEARVCGTDVICTDIPELREAALGEGTFIAKDRMEEDLPAHFLRFPSRLQGTRPSYLTTREKAARMLYSISRS